MGHGDGDGHGEVLSIRTADLKAAAPIFQQQAVSLGTALTTLVTTLDGLGAPWGDDDQGTQFSDAYKPQQTNIEGAAGILVLGLTSIHEAMADMSDGFVDNEEAIRGMFTPLDPKSPQQQDGSGR
ncbi:hypothetical protein [Actinacidiphila bryophytorum]|uniref:WXG100 family type VII secretion target n=1 Tax=Actinacidiphila bryophytorum TaxID=1436133 RepID=A0A9W4H115_9ACTN|nr:hypothetical protein [Actinacidiphila bryophytorum]MBM9439929.1 hypothetical protein [Actinacidiphila bryophytorum]MBN6546245.1 hypothetical protein [Actinacidiphila bryophytorum]CAG7640659.1 conserved hypothetical protein [Actinacidiphila bryophytorum]